MSTWEVRIEKKGTGHPKRFRVPAHQAKGILILLADFRVRENEESLSIDEAFSHLYEESNKGAVLLRGFRARDDLTQTELAVKVGTTQSVIAEMESGKRSIGKKMAQKLALCFATRYQEFI